MKFSRGVLSSAPGDFIYIYIYIYTKKKNMFIEKRCFRSIVFILDLIDLKMDPARNFDHVGGIERSVSFIG